MFSSGPACALTTARATTGSRTVQAGRAMAAAMMAGAMAQQVTMMMTCGGVTLRDPIATTGQWRTVGQELLDSGRQQERTLEALLTLATSEAGLSRREPADLSEAAAIALQHARAQIQQRQLRVRTWLGSAPLYGDPDLIERLAANLIDNAVQHNVPDGAIDVATRREGGQVIMSVANTGPVIPPADIDRLFQPFQRAAGRSGDGHGLGLSIVAAIATAHGAALTTRAQPQGGLRIQVSFPAAGGPWRQPRGITTKETASVGHRLQQLG